jgi:hypothetical protein
VAAKPDGKSPNDRFVFTRPATERISKVVRLVEGGDRDSAGLTLRKGIVAQPSESGSPISFAYWTATTNWTVVSINGATTTNNTKVISFAFNTANTALCTNHLAPLPLLTTVVTNATQIVLALRENGEWRLIGAQA